MSRIIYVIINVYNGVAMNPFADTTIVITAV